MNRKYRKTIYACFTAYIVQAVVNNFIPLLFVMFHDAYGISLEKITLLVTFNFGLQLLIDLAAIGFIDKIGYRAALVIAHILAVVGLVSMTILPEITSDPFLGLLAAVMIYAVGGGLLEVVVSPVVEACPTDNKGKAMSLLHSFYCWGHVGVVLVSTIFFKAAGMENWKILALVWALIPLVNTLVFTRVPIAPLVKEGEQGLTMKELFGMKIFWLFLVMMVCSGASEQAVSQWASALAERGLGVSKAVGDLAGPMSFAVFMGASRAFYGKWGDRIDLEKFMLGSTLLCVSSYLIIALVPIPVLGLVGCGLSGLAVGIMWPGTFSLASVSIGRGGTAMFALLALGGDLGCSSGPALAGALSGLADGNLRMGILGAIVFPALLLLILLANHKASSR